MGLRDRLEAKQNDAFARARTFEHTFLDVPKLERIDAEEGRRYLTPSGKAYPSVTTVLGATEDHTWLDEWRDRIGHQEADNITAQSGRRGTALHRIVERYLLNEPNYLDETISPLYLDLFKQVKPRVDASIGKIYGIELGLYSDILRIAGTTDLVADWNGLPSIIDWKNARRFKTEDDIQGYYQQTCCYSVMVEELTGLKIKQLVIVMAVEGNTGPALVFTISPSTQYPAVAKMIKAYYASKS